MRATPASLSAIGGRGLVAGAIAQRACVRRVEVDVATIVVAKGAEYFMADKDGVLEVRLEISSDPGGSYELTTTLIHVVDEIPADVEAAFQRHDDGERVYD